ncbi:MAG TPA: hypothetical protein ENJ20_03485, partial [Bacteroidetes bacterium]|nr:hypothetical protein [Bacteroidota bacterium]
MNFLKSISLSCLFLFVNLSAHAQVFYYVDDMADIYTYDLSTCESTFVVHIQGTPTSYRDITFAPDGNLYVVSLTKLYKIDLVTGASTLLTTLCANTNLCGTNAMTSDTEGNIYMAGKRLYSYNIYTQTT